MKLKSPIRYEIAGGKMEIDFIFQWKKKAENKDAIKSKIIGLLSQLFSDIRDDSFSFSGEKGTLYNFKYKCSSKNRIGYLKILCYYSEAKSANLLSNIRNLIINSQYRRDFLIICSYDEASLSFCCRLMKPFGSFERHLRELIYLITVKAFGIDWVDKTMPLEIIEHIKKKTKGKVTGQSLTESAFEYLDYQEIIDYLFTERYFQPLEQVLEYELSNENLETLSKNEIISIISNARKCSLWNRLFFKKTTINQIDSATLKRIRDYRNDIMHQHVLDYKKSQEIRTAVKQADNCIKQAISEMENIIYNETDIISVFSGIGSIFSMFFQQITQAVSNIDFSELNRLKENYINSALKNLAGLVRLNDSYQKHITDAFASIINQLPDYSSIIPRISTPKITSLPQGAIDKLAELAISPSSQQGFDITKSTDEAENESGEEDRNESNDS